MSLSDPRFFQLRRGVKANNAPAGFESWLVQAERCRSAVERSLPDAAIELHFNLGSTGRGLFDERNTGALPQRTAWITGPHAVPLFIEKETANCDLVGVRLHPVVAEQILGIPAAELRNTLVDLDAVWGPRAVETIRDRLFAELDPAKRLDIVDHEVGLRLRHSGHTADALLARRLSAAVSATPSQSVSAIATSSGLSHRKVIALFDRYIGLKPKAYHRVDRLRRVLDLVHDGRQLSWTQIALGCGYFDQSHFINDFRAQAGVLPEQYLAARSSIGRGFMPYRLAASD